MKERPILFTPSMVRDILDGRKTSTRRIIKYQPHESDVFDGISRGSFVSWKSPRLGTNAWLVNKCPYGKPGDRLWVRERFNSDWCDKVIYFADGGSAREAGYSAEPKWKPSIHMPRWASRLNLLIKELSVERLQDGGDREFWGEEQWAQNPWVWKIEFEKINDR